MPSQVVPIQGVDQVGLVQDISPVALPQNAFSDCRNVRFRDSAVSKMEGEVNILPYIDTQNDEDVVQYVAWWPNPNLAFANAGYYLIIVQQVSGTTLVDNAYLVQVGELGDNNARITLEPTAASPNFKGTFRTNGNWQHTFFQGGFTLIVNNGLEAPRFILDSEDNTITANVSDFAELPGWDSYAVVTDTTTVPPTETTIATVTAGVVRAFGDFLVAGNLIERDSDNAVVRGLPGIIRSSDIAAPGNVPQNWNPFLGASNTADEFTITNDGIVQDMVELQGNLFIYSNSSISLMTRTGNAQVPLSIRPVTTAYGAITTDSVLEFDGRHFVVGGQDIYVFGGHPGSIQSVADGKVRRAFYRKLNPLHIDNTFVLRYQQRDELWICFANTDSTSGLVNEALIYNYRLNNWTSRDLTNVVAGDIAPVPGGGLPTAALGFTGISGDNGQTTAGVVHSNQITQTDPRNIFMQHAGYQTDYEILIGTNFPLIGTSATGTPVHFVQIGHGFCSSQNALGQTSPTNVALNLETQARTAGRFLQVPNGDGTTRDFDFTVELPPDLQAFDPTIDTRTEEDFRTEILYPIFAGLARDPNYSWPRAADTDRPQWFVDNANDLVVNNDAPLTLHLSSEYNIFAIRFEPITGEPSQYSSAVTLGAAVGLFNEEQLIAQGRARSGDDRTGDFIDASVRERDIGAETGRASTFYFDFRGLVDEDPNTGDDIDDLIFFFDNIPTNAVVFAGVPTMNTLGDTSDGMTPGDTPGDMMDGGTRDDSFDADGERRVMWDFTANVVIDEPLIGANIRSTLQYMQGMTDIELHEIAYQVWIPGADHQTTFDLVAYSLPEQSFGKLGGTTTSQSSVLNIDVDGIDDDELNNLPPIIEFSGRFEEFYEDGLNNFGFHDPATAADGQRDFNGHVIPAGVGDFEVSVALATLETDRDRQRQIFAQEIHDAFLNNPNSLLQAVGDIIEVSDSGGPDDGKWRITLRSFANAPVTLSGQVRGDDDRGIGFGTNGDIEITRTTEGLFATTNVPTPINENETRTPVRQITPPIIDIGHVNNDLSFFNFNTQRIVLRNDPTGTSANDLIDIDTWLGTIISDRIIEASSRADGTRPQWTASYNSTTDVATFTTAAVEYDDADDSGVANPDDGGLVAFPAERTERIFTSTLVTQGSGEFQDPSDLTATRLTFGNPASTIATQGAYEIRAIPTYATLRVRENTENTVEEIVYLLDVGDTKTSADDVVREFVLELTRRVPRLTAQRSGVGQLDIQPANYTDLANFVLEFRINDTLERTERMRALLDSSDTSEFIQDPLNVKPYGNLPDRVRDTSANYLQQASCSSPVMLATLEQTNEEPTLEFDVLRPWPKSQVNFTREFPIFAATRLFPDGTTTNKILGADIGYSRPAFMEPTVAREETFIDERSQVMITGQDQPEPYESFVVRTQMGLAPEFTTEMLNSVAMWTDGSTQEYFRGPSSYNRLEFRATTTNAPGATVDFNALPDNSIENIQYISEDYKVDVRLTGRFLNWKLTDNANDPDLRRNDKDFDQLSEWRLSGLQLDIGQGGRR